MLSTSTVCKRSPFITIISHSFNTRAHQQSSTSSTGTITMNCSGTQRMQRHSLEWSVHLPRISHQAFRMACPFAKSHSNPAPGPFDAHWHRQASTRQQPRLKRVFTAAAAAELGTTLQGSSDVGIVIVDHGSRKRESNTQLVHFGTMYKEMTGSKIVEIAHMEIAEPTIEQAIGQCVSAGAKTVVVAPYFLSNGRHIQEDIPNLVREAQAKYQGVKCVIADPIGVDPLMAQLINNRVKSALSTATAEH